MRAMRRGARCDENVTKMRHNIEIPWRDAGICVWCPQDGVGLLFIYTYLDMRSLTTYFLPACLQISIV